MTISCANASPCSAINTLEQAVTHPQTEATGMAVVQPETGLRTTRLPLRFDGERLAAELATVPAHAWAPHPNGIPGNASVRLISAGGGANDDVTGRMQATPAMAALPYIRQVLASFGVVWSRSRLMRLAPGAAVPLMRMDS